MKPRAPRVEIHIRELVVDGFSRPEAGRMTAAIEQALARRFSGGAGAMHAAHASRPVRINVPAQRDVAGAIGRNVANAVYRSSAGKEGKR
jgi:hypothetical protein